MEERGPAAPAAEPAQLKNPLPLPKEHPHEPISFPLEPAAEKDCFDVEIGEDDDFDL